MGENSVSAKGTYKSGVMPSNVALTLKIQSKTSGLTQAESAGQQLHSFLGQIA
jgi:hypothetical protein